MNKQMLKEELIKMSLNVCQELEIHLSGMMYTLDNSKKLDAISHNIKLLQYYIDELKDCEEK